MGTQVDHDVTLMPASDVAHHLKTDIHSGLSSDEAQRRLDRDGPNELESAPPTPLWRRLLSQFQDPLIYLLLVAIAISLVAWWSEGASGIPIDAVVISLIVIVNAIIGFVEENKAESAVAALSDMTATHSTVLRDGLLTDIPSAQIVVGDILVLSEGDAVGADGRIVEASALRLQEASLTGESEASGKHSGVLDQASSLGDRDNMAFKGTAVAGGVGKVVITSTGMNTEVGQIARLLDDTEKVPSPLQREINKISKMLGILVIGIAIIVMVTLAIINGVNSASEAVDILLLGVSLAVAAVPEGLPAILSLVLAIGVQAMAKRNAVMKELHSVETLGSVSVICSDKTGTLTKNEMTLREIVTASGRVRLDGIGYHPKGQATVEGDQERTLQEARWTVAGGAIANNAQLVEVDGVWEVQGDPTEGAFLVAGHKLDGVHDRVSSFERSAEIPFSSDRKMMSVLGSNPDRDLYVFSKGAPDVLLTRCSREQVGGETDLLTDERRDELNGRVVELSAQGYRTLGVAWRRAVPGDTEQFDDESEKDLVFVGIVAIIDPPRDEAKTAIREAHRAGIRTVMITGDHPVTASRIAQDLGISRHEEPRALTGQELDGLDGEELVETVRNVDIYARVAPEHKLQLVDALQEDGTIVAMTGDGVNDAPALKSADIGIAMGITGTEVTKEAATMILGDDNYSTIVAAVRQGRIIFDNIKKFMRYLLSSNMGEVATVFLGVLLGVVIGLQDPADPAATVIPLLATQILWINLVTDSGPALAMGMDPEIDDVMARSPRHPEDHIIDRAMWGKILYTGLIMGVLNLIVYDLFLPGGLFETGLESLVPVDSQLETAQTTVFTALVFMQLFNALNARSDLASAFHHLFTNKWLWLSIAFVIVTQILVVEGPFLQAAFGTVSLSWQHWLTAIIAGSLILVCEETFKAVRRRRAATPTATDQMVSENAAA